MHITNQSKNPVAWQSSSTKLVETHLAIITGSTAIAPESMQLPVIKNLAKFVARHKTYS